MGNYGQHFSALSTPQTEAASPLQRPNNAGGFSFVLDPFARLDRFLILGSDSGTFYVTEKKLTVDNAKNIQACVALDGLRTIARIVEVSDRGLAVKNDPAIFALAVCAGATDPVVRKAALEALPKVARIGTHLFHFARDVEHFRKWGRGLRSAIGAWYNDKPAEVLARDLVKYRQRDGWSHRDLLRLSHARASSPQHAALYRYVTAGAEGMGQREVKRSKDGPAAIYGALEDGSLPAIIGAFEEAQRETSVPRLVALVTEHGLTHEMLPTTCLKSQAIWEALLVKMPMTALIRNLGRMTSLGLMGPMSSSAKLAASKIADVAALKKARVHPMSVLIALRTYQQGRGDKGSLTWSPERSIVDSLDEAYYMSFDAIEPTGKNTMLALDISGSMEAKMSNLPLSCREASACLAMVTARTEANYCFIGFSHTPIQLNISAKQRLDDVIRTISGLPFGSTDCSLPMQVAQKSKIEIDTFHVYTDSETYAGRPHPHQALQEYRNASGRPAKLAVVGMTATEISIANPEDPGMLDVVGFSSDVPAVIANFAR